MGWNSEPDYTPPNPPWWFWTLLAGILFSPLILYLLFG
jgi:hypothetical protein